MTKPRALVGVLPVAQAGALAASILLGSIQFWLLGVGTEQDSGSIATRLAVRFAVFAPVALTALVAPAELRRLVRSPVCAGFVLFGLTTIAAALLAERPFEEADRALMFALFLTLALLVGRALALDDQLAVIAATGILLTGAGTIGHVAGWLPEYDIEFFNDSVASFPRASGLQAAANPFGRGASFLAIIGIILWRRSSRRALAALSVVVGTVGLVLAQSRVPAVSLLAGMFFLFVPDALRRAKLIVPLVVAGCIALLGGALSGIGLSAVLRTENSAEATTFLGRTPVWERALAEWDRSPSWGVGIETLGRRFDDWEGSGLTTWDPGNAHNLLIQVGAAHGAVALTVLIVTLGMAVAVVRRDPTRVASTLLMMLLMQGLTEAIFTGNPELSVAATVAVVAGTARRRSGTDGEAVPALIPTRTLETDAPPIDLEHGRSVV